MIPNPACLGLEALVPKDTIAYHQIQKMSTDLNNATDELFKQMGLFRNAHNLYTNGHRSPTAYVAAMRAMNLKQPGELVEMYASVENAYDAALQAYERCIDRFSRFCKEHSSDEQCRLAYQNAFESIQLHQHNLLCLDPRANGEIDIAPMTDQILTEDVSDASMEGFFKNIIESIKHTFTRDLKCKEIMEGVISQASNASKEANDKFKSFAHEFKCPPADEMKEGIAYVGPTSKFLSERFEDFKEAHKSIFTRKMSAQEQKNYWTKFLREHRAHFNQWGARYGDFHLVLKKDGTYGSLGYDIRNAIQLFKAFDTTAAGTRKCLKSMYELASGHTQIDSIIPVATGDGVTVVITTSIKKEWRLCVAHLERLLDIYDRVDYSIYRMGKDIKSCL